MPFRSLFAHRLILVLFLQSVLLSGCNKEQNEVEQQAAPVPVVVATSYPLASLAHLIAGETIDLRYPVPAEQESPDWSPTDADITLMQQADLLLLSGAGHERWVKTVMLSPLTQTVTSMGVRNEWKSITADDAHQHGPEGQQVSGDYNPYIWMNPRLFTQQLRVTKLALQDIMPDQRDELEKRADRLIDRLEKLDANLQQVCDQLAPSRVYYSQPELTYFVEYFLQDTELVPLTEEVPINADALVLWCNNRPTAQAENLIEFDPLDQGVPTESVIDKMEANLNRLKASN